MNIWLSSLRIRAHLSWRTGNISMFSMCSELTPRACIPDTRIPQLMQPCPQKQELSIYLRPIWNFNKIIIDWPQLVCFWAFSSHHPPLIRPWSNLGQRKYRLEDIWTVMAFEFDQKLCTSFLCFNWSREGSLESTGMKGFLGKCNWSEQSLAKM